MDFSKIAQLPFIPNKHRVELAMASFKEKIRGLDFTMPDRMYDRNRNDGAMYYASPEKILKELFSCVDMNKFHSFIDIGCGKGYVLWEAKKFGFPKVGGVEYDEKLVEICNRNMKKLKLSDSVTVECGDACTFERYGEYDVFYFFNPFVDEIMHKVIDQIIAQCRGKEIMIIYYRPRYTDAIENCGYFTKEHVLHDDVKDYMANVYRGVIPE